MKNSLTMSPALVALLMQGLKAHAALAWTCQQQMLDHKKLMVVYCGNLQNWDYYKDYAKNQVMYCQKNDSNPLKMGSDT